MTSVIRLRFSTSCTFVSLSICDCLEHGVLWDDDDDDEQSKNILETTTTIDKEHERANASTLFITWKKPLDINTSRNKQTDLARISEKGMLECLHFPIRSTGLGRERNISGLNYFCNAS